MALHHEREKNNVLFSLGHVRLLVLCERMMDRTMQGNGDDAAFEQRL